MTFVIPLLNTPIKHSVLAGKVNEVYIHNFSSEAYNVTAGELLRTETHRRHT